MAFPVELASVLSGASVRQLRDWRTRGLVVPEVRVSRPMQYSFRDLALLRTVMWLRTETSLQKVRTAFNSLTDFELSDHPSSYKFATGGKSIAVWTDEGFMDLVKQPGQLTIFTLADVYRPFETKTGRQVVDFEQPKRHLRVNARRMGGWPTIEGTRIPYDTVALLLEGGEVKPKDVHHYYPNVSAAAARDAVAFDHLVRPGRSA